MAFAETAPLVAQLRLDDKFSGPLRKASGALSSFGANTARIGQGFKTIGAGLGVAARNLAILGVVAAGSIAAGLLKSVREGQEATKVQLIYANAVANSGRVSTQYVSILNAQQKALMNLGGVDDELIKTEQTRLIQMGLTGEQVAKLTPLVLDFAKATGIDLLTATKLAGKAVNGNVGALSRYGVQIDKTKAKVDPFGATVDALNSKFGGTTKALSGTLDARLGALRENLANVREEAGMKLLPALTRIVDVAGKDLVPAFGKFIDRILPAVSDGIEKFASMLENGGAERGLKAITDALGPMVDLLRLAAAPVKAIVGAFLSLPSQVQGILVGGFAINKLSGGLIGQGVGQVVGGLLQRGSSPANPLFVADVSGGLGKGLIPGAAATAGGIGLGTVAAGAALTAGTVGLLAAAQGAFDKSTQAEQNVRDFVNGKRTGFKVAFDDDSLRRLGKIFAPAAGADRPDRTRLPAKIGPIPGPKFTGDPRALAVIASRGEKAGFHPTDKAILATFARNQERLAAVGARAAEKAAEAAGASRDAVIAARQNPIVVPAPNTSVKVTVNVTAAQVAKSVVIQRRFGPPGGSRESDAGHYGGAGP